MIPLQAWWSVVGELETVELKPGVWQVGDYILKRTTRLGSADPRTRLPQYCEVLAHLDRAGIPVGAPLPTDDGHPFAEYEGELFILSPFLAGPITADSPRQFEHTGAAIARLHQALATSPPIDSWEIQLGERVFGEAWPKLEANLPPVEFKRLSAAVSPIKDAMVRAFEGLPMQRIHGDCHAGNILLTGDEVTGLIDLDHLPIGPRVYDLGYYLSCGVTACTEGGETPAGALERLGRPLLAGYRTVAPITAAESTALVPTMLAVQLILADLYVQAGNQSRAERSLAFTRWAAELAWQP